VRRAAIPAVSHAKLSPLRGFQRHPSFYGCLRPGATRKGLSLLTKAFAREGVVNLLFTITA
jgi:hypothetical protein